MKLRRRTLRRLGAFLVVLALVGSFALWMHGRGARRQARELLEERRTGLELLAMGDYEGALRPLTHYLADGDPKTVERDFTARLAHARARLHVYESGERHIEQSARLLADLVDDFPDEPGRIEALHLLMRAAAEGGDWSQLQRLCDETLDEYPQDRLSLQMRRQAAERQANLAAALADSQRLNDLAPHDVEEQLWTMRLMAWMGRPREAIVRHAVDLTERYPQDPRFLLVLAVAYQNAEQEQQAVACLVQAAQSELPEDDRVAYVARLAGLFDAFGEHDLALNAFTEAVRRTPAEHPDHAALYQRLALRLWQAGRLEEALAVVPAVDPQRPQPIELVATRILLQFERAETAEATHGLTLLGRTLDQPTADAAQRRSALAWHEALSAAYSTGPNSRPRPVRERLEQLQKAYTRLLGDPVRVTSLGDEPAGLFLKWIGDLYAQLRESDQAIRHWQAAASLLPGWDEPHLLVAEATLERGLQAEARQAIAGALSRAREENLQRARVLRVRIAYESWLDAPSVVGLEETAALAAEHQRSDPLDARTLPIHVHMTALANREAARQLVLERLQLGLDPALCVQLAQVSALAGLGLEERLLGDVADPAAIEFLATRFARQGRLERASRLADSLLSMAAPASDIERRMALARILQTFRPREAAAIWDRLGQAHPADIEVQLAILDSAEAAQLDRQAIANTIERVAQLTGPSGRRWRLEKARWLLAERTAGAAMESADLLRGLIRDSAGSDAIDARVLLAEALTLGGNEEVAREHLEAAFALDSSRADVGLLLIGLLERSGRRDEAVRLLGQLAADGVRGARPRLEVAARLAELGELATAISLLRQAAEAGVLQPEGRMVLAELLQRDGRPGEARAIYDELLARSDPPPEVFLQAATYYREQGDAERASEVLVRLEQAPLAAPEREVILGAYYAGAGEIETARLAFSRALEAAPGYAGPWREAIGFELIHGQPDQAKALALRARDAGIGDARVQALAIQADAMSAVASDAAIPDRLDALATAAADSPALKQHAQAITRAVRALREPRQLDALERSRLTDAASVFDRYPALYTTLVEAHLAAGAGQEAARLARRLVEVAPADPEAHRLAFESARLAQRTVDATRYARRWRELAGPEADPDSAVAQARLLAGDAAGALRSLASYLPVTNGQPTSARIRLLATEAYARGGEHTKALELVRPWLARSPEARALAIRMAGEPTADAETAERWLTAVEAVLQDLESLPIEPTSPAAADQSRQRLELAVAWTHVGQRHGREDFLAHGRAWLLDLTSGPLRQEPAAWEALADAARRADDLDQAETAYRRVLALDPRRASAANELARLLLASEEPAMRSEALTWAGVAVEQIPRRAAFHETLARALIARETPEQAVASFERSLRLDDQRVSSMIGLAALLIDSGQDALAGRLFDRLRTRISGDGPLPSEVARELEALRAKFASRVDA